METLGRRKLDVPDQTPSNLALRDQRAQFTPEFVAWDLRARIDHIFSVQSL